MGCNCGGSERRQERRVSRQRDAQAAAGTPDVPARLKRGGGKFWTGTNKSAPKEQTA